jgi:hypothetical protein
MWIADAHCGDGKRFVVRADEKLLFNLLTANDIALKSNPHRFATRRCTCRKSACCPFVFHHFSFARRSRHFSNTSLIRSAVSFLPFAALSVDPMD